MNSNHTNEVGLQQMNQIIQSQSRINTEPTIKQGSINDNANSIQQMSFNGNRNKKEQEQQTQPNSSSQHIFIKQNQHISKQKQQEITNENIQSTFFKGIQAADMNLHNYSMQLHTQTQNNVTTDKQNLQNQQINSQKIQSRIRSNHSYLSGSSIINQADISQTQSSSKYFQPAYDLFFEIQRKIDKETVQILKNQLPLGKKQEKILQYEAGNIISFIKIIFEYILSQNAELKSQNMELINTQKLMNEYPSTNQQNTTSQSNVNGVCDDNSIEITCKYCKEYEQQLQKLEAEIRQHIRVQQLLKLHAENYQTKIEELERENIKYNDNLQNKIKEYEEMKNKFEDIKISEQEMKNNLEDIQKDIQITQEQKQQLEKELDKVQQKNKEYELKLGSKQQQQSNVNINANALPSQQLQIHQPYMKTKSIVNNKHILDSFFDEGLQLEDKSSSSKATISSLSTAQPLQRSEEIQKHIIQIDSQKEIQNKNNQIRGKKLSWNENDKQNTYDEKQSKNEQDKQISSRQYQNQSNKCVQIDDKPINNDAQNQNFISQFQKQNEMQSEELFNIQKKLKKLQKISETKLQNTFGSNVQSTNTNNQQENLVQKQLTERNDSTDKYFKPHQFQPNTQRLNTTSNLCGGSAEKPGNKKSDEKNTFNSLNYQKQQNNSFNVIKGQQIQYQGINSNHNSQNTQIIPSQNGVNFLSTKRNMQQINHPLSQVIQRDINNISNCSFNITKTSQVGPNQQQNIFAQNINQYQIQVNHNQNQNKSLTRQSSAFYSRNNQIQNNTERYSQISHRANPSKYNSSVQQFANTSGNISSNSHNLSSNNLSQIVNQQFKSPIIQHNSNTISKYGIQCQISQKQFENQQNYLQQQLQNKYPSQNISTIISVNNYVNPINNQKSLSPSKTYSGKKLNVNQNISTDNGNKQIIQITNLQNGQQIIQNQKSFDKLRAFMNSPKFQTDDEPQSNLRSQSMDGQSSNNINMNNQKIKNYPQNQNQFINNQKSIKQQTSNQYQVNLSMNSNQNQLNSYIHNKSHF